MTEPASPTTDDEAGPAEPSSETDSATQIDAPLMSDALVTITTRFGLAILIFGSDIVLARLLGPAAKGRFALVLLYSQLAAVLVGWGMDSALAVVSGRDARTARSGFANAVIWSAVVGGFCVVLSAALYGLPTDVRPRGPLADLIPNLSAQQFIYAALALPGELFFAVGLFALLGRRRIVAYSLIRVARRGVFVVFVVAAALVARLSLDVALVLNLVALAATAGAIGWVVWRDGTFSLRPSAALMREELRFGTRALPGTLAERLQFRADSFLVNAIQGVRWTGIYSVTSGLAETLWYIPNALGTVMFSRAVDPKADAGHIAAVLSRTTILVTLFLAIPAFALGPRLVKIVYGSQFSDAGIALRLILPGVVAYSVVAVLSRYIVGRGRPGTGTLVLVAGLGANIACNLVLIPRFGIEGAAASSSISYGLTAVITVVVFRHLSGVGFAETLLARPTDIVAVMHFGQALVGRLRGRRGEPIVGLRGGPTEAEIVLGEHQQGEER